MASASSSALAASITATVSSARASGEPLPALGGGGGPQRLGDIALAVVRTRSAQRNHLLARDADAAQQRLHGELRMLDRGRNARVAVAAAADQLPGLRVEREVEAGQHDGAARELGDGGDQLGGRRHGAGRAGGDHGSVRVRGKPRRFGLDQRVAARGRLDGAPLGENFRPVLARDLQEFERELPVAVERFGHEPVEPVPRHAARGHVVHQPREIVGERERRGGVVGDERRLAARIGRNLRGPFEHELRQLQAPFEPAERRRQRQRVGGERAGRRLREGDLVLVDVADGDDARQDRRALLGGVEEEIARQPAGAPRRQIERGVRERERIAPSWKARHQRSVDERADQRRHERRRSRDGEDAGGGGHPPILKQVLITWNQLHCPLIPAKAGTQNREFRASSLDSQHKRVYARP
jgi:hypothetical protein